MDAGRLNQGGMANQTHSRRVTVLTTMGVAPALFFLAFFFILTWPAVTRFHTHFFADEGDGLQNAWNLWWINRATTVLHQNPWQTNYIHYPYGTSLVGHTLNPFNGFVAIPLLRFMSLVTAHNTIVTFSFVATGVTMFLLAYYLTASYWPSLIAGFMLTFSNFHFSHAEGHLQLVALEWIPLFMLLWLRLVMKPSVGLGFGAALTLFLVILCDYYYFLYCVMAGAIVLCWSAVRDGISWFADRRRMIALATFVTVVLATSGVLAGSLFWSNIRDPLTRAHPTSEFSLDLLSPIIYGGHWRFASLTSGYWMRLQANFHESSVHLGFSMIGLVLYVWSRRAELNAPILRLFYFLFVFFLIAALGPTLQIAGKSILPNQLVLPYAVLPYLFPPLALSGVPIRMIVMVVLSGAVICAFGFMLLLRGSTGSKAAAAAVICLLLVEYLPKPIPTVQVAIPEYVRVLHDLPGDDGVVDTVSPPSVALLYQTIHEKPLALGYPVARLPRSVEAKDRQLERLLQSERFDRLWSDYRLKYVVSTDPAGRLKGWSGTRTVWNDGRVGVFDVSQLESTPATTPR
jgi:hypothetical protein